MITRIFIPLCILLFLVGGCKTSQQAISTSTPIEEEPIISVEFEERDLDTLVISASRPDPVVEEVPQVLDTYNPSYTLRNNLLHTKLDVRFDWQKEQVIGTATLTLTPYFYPVDAVTLDAKGFEVKSVKNTTAGKGLSYDYNGQSLTIQLERTYKKGEEYDLEIEYIATPAAEGGSNAITSDKGLFFINPRNEDKRKPMQIWTQGETEHNSRWFPTIDKPNERCTQEMYVTVDKRFETLSNGLLISQNENPDGTRTDYYKLDKPHAPYLFMLAIGEFAVVRESWKGKPVEYFVEPKFREFAKDIYPHTTEMLEFFSQKLDYEYPWPKYSQVVVRDYVSGAMENTTAVIFGDFMQGDRKEIGDRDINQLIVAHEMFHHWFGDLVTCESWANLTMNEGFANYSEYLWMEHKHGKDAAEAHRKNEIGGYMSQIASGSIHPLIHFGYNNKEDMFDAHSYNKGGLVLHMLRNYIGDDAFWASLNLYLKENEYTAVEAHDLRLAIEEVTGEDWNWFFNQWYFSSGHPKLDISKEYDAAAKRINITIEQTQDAGIAPGIFILPMDVELYFGDTPVRTERILLNQRKQTFSLPAASKPDLILVDPGKITLAEVTEEKTVDEFIIQYEKADGLFDRVEALEQLANSDDMRVLDVLTQALNDPFWAIRANALEIADVSNPSVMSTIEALAKDDPRSDVQAVALARLAQTGDVQYADIAKSAIRNGKTYTVISAGLSTLQQISPGDAITEVKQLESIKNPAIVAAVSGIYAGTEDMQYLPYFEQNMSEVDGFAAISFFENYEALLSNADGATQDKAIQSMNTLAQNMTASPWKRFASTKTLYTLLSKLKLQSSVSSGDESVASRIDFLTNAIKTIKENETEPQLKQVYQNFQL